MINVAEDVRKDVQIDMLSSLIKADTQLIDSKHLKCTVHSCL